MALITASTFIAARSLRAVCISGALSLCALYAGASPPPQPAGAQTPETAAVAAAAKASKSEVRPRWAELTPSQQQVLAPLAQEWSTLDGNHKTKWIAICNKYAAMSPEQQKRLQENIRDWAKLTPEQHQIARETYARAKKLNTEQKTAQWQQYQQLPEAQKQQLAANAAAKKRVATLPNPKNKTKVVEPLKSAHKPATAYGRIVPQTANRPSVPAAKPPFSSAAAAARPITPLPTPLPATVPPTAPATAPAANK